MKSLLGLVMLVKNEARGIAETLQSIAPFISRWTILDTGSTDGTQAIIRRELAYLPGGLYEEAFVDFATSRNRVLDLHAQVTQYTITLSGDDVLLGGELIQAGLTGHEVYNIERQLGSSSFMMPAIQRTDTDWRYVGRTHEVLTKPDHFATEGIPGVRVIRHHDGEPAAKHARWLLDLELLSEDLEEAPTNSRAAFYRAQTFECLGRLHEAAGAYARRAMMPGWVDETYEAMFRLARVVALQGGPWEEVEKLYLMASAYDRRRAEPLYAIAEHWHLAGNRPLAYAFAKHAASLPRPDTRMFIDAEVYAWKARALCMLNSPENV